jgi:hypothetical protein
MVKIGQHGPVVYIHAAAQGLSVEHLESAPTEHCQPSHRADGKNLGGSRRLQWFATVASPPLIHTLSAMEPKEALEIAAKAFVQRSFQERFVHEALKKPDRLMRRICHEIDSVFVSEFLNRTVDFERPSKCFVFELTGRLSSLSWKEAKKLVSMGRYQGTQ